MVATLLADARRAAGPPAARLAPFPVIVVPHAGYIYSGHTAAAAFNRAAVARLAIILAPNHTGVVDAPGGASLWERGAFHTPLGDVPIAEQLAATILQAAPLVGIDHAAHRAEHAVEVELPFLQLLRSDIQIVPIVLAWDDWERAQQLGLALAGVIRASAEPILLIASSDLNHYEPAAVSVPKDERALAAIEMLDGAELLARCRRERITMCGRSATAAVLAAARALGAERAEVLDYRHSGAASGDDTQVVGYAGVGIAIP